MKSSIRTFLLINLLLSVTLIISLAVIGNLFLTHKDIQIQLDAQLTHTTLRIRSFFSDFNENQRDIATIQKSLLVPLNHDLKRSLHFERPESVKQQLQIKALKEANDNTEFQIWDDNGRLILHSAGAPKIPLSNGKNGISTLWLSGNSWRVSTLYDPQTQLTFIASERIDYRQTLENKLTKDSIIIMLITYPFLGLLIWVIVGRGLDPLKKVANEVSHRAASYLKPVNLTTVPAEITPLITELNHLFQRLQEAFDREKRFTADAAHELRTPLAALNTYTQVALRAKTPEERKEALLKVLTGVNRGTHVIQQLLTLNRVTPEAMKAEAVPVDISKEATEIAIQLAPEAVDKKIELEMIHCEQPTIITGYPTAIGILIRNLVDNAIRYSPEGSTVSIKPQYHHGQLVLHVIDNGPGVPKELRERIFERFFRVIGSQATGSGLGLGIVQQIAKLHGAEIRLETPESGRGLDFQVWFPKGK